MMLMANGGDLKAYQTLMVYRDSLRTAKVALTRLDQESQAWQRQLTIIKALEARLSAIEINPPPMDRDELFQHARK
jgi:hypothetical protein